MARSVTTSCGTTGAIVLDPVMKSTTVALSFSFAVGSSNSTCQIDYTLDDPSQFGGPTTTWSLLSSAAIINSSQLTAGMSWTVLAPIGGVRLNVPANSSNHSYTLKALQSVTA